MEIAIRNKRCERYNVSVRSSNSVVHPGVHLSVVHDTITHSTPILFGSYIFMKAIRTYLSDENNTQNYYNNIITIILLSLLASITKNIVHITPKH